MWYFYRISKSSHIFLFHIRGPFFFCEWGNAISTPPSCRLPYAPSENSCLWSSLPPVRETFWPAWSLNMNNWAQNPKENEKNNLWSKQILCLCGFCSWCVNAWCDLSCLHYLVNIDNMGSARPGAWGGLLGTPAVPMPRVLLPSWLSACPYLPAEPSVQRLGRDSCTPSVPRVIWTPTAGAKEMLAGTSGEA